MTLTLKGAIVSKFGSAQGLARAVGWSGRKARDITSGRQTLTSADTIVLANALEVRNPQDFVALFFPQLSTKQTNRSQ